MKTELMERKANISSLSEFDPVLSNYEELLRCKKGLDLIRAYNLCRPETSELHKLCAYKRRR